MKSWFAKMKLSAALDAGPRPSPSLPPKSHSSDDLRRFEQELAALHAELKETAPKAQVPDSLHRSILRAVQAAERPKAAAPRLALLRWLAVPAVTALALLVAWHALRSPVKPPVPEPQSLAAAASALEAGGQMARAVPSAVVAPLSDELQGLKGDLTTPPSTCWPASLNAAE